VGDSLFLDGYSGVVLGPILLAEGELASVGAITNTRWAIEPQVKTLHPGDLDVFIRGWSTMADSLRLDGGLNVNSLHRGGRFGTVATGIQANVRGLNAVAPVVFLIIAALTVLALVELARLLSVVRSGEYLLFWSRGDTIRALMTVAAIEAAAVSLVGATLGTAAAWLVLAQPIGTLGAVAWLAPAAAVVVTAVVFGVRACVDARAVARGGGSEENGRAASITGIAAPVLLSVGAGVSTWQLLLYGSPLSTTRDGSTQVDPIAVFAPALGVLALVAISGVLAPLLGRLVDSIAPRTKGRAVVARTLARRSRLFAAIFVLFALATGQLTLASAYAQTWDSAYATATALRAGSALTIEDARAPLTDQVLTSVQDVRGVQAVAPVYSEQVTVGATPASMLAIAPAALRELGTTAGGLFNTSAAADRISLTPTGPTIPGDARDITVSATSDGAAPAGLSVLIADEFGVQHELEAADSFRFTLPAGHGDWTVLAFIVHLSRGGPSAFAVTSVVADGVAVDIGGGWAAQGFDPLRAPVSADATGVGFSEARALSSVRLSPLSDGLIDALSPSVLISSELADTARLRVGDTVPITLDARLGPINCVVAEIVAAIPGAKSEPAVLLDGSLVQAIRARFYEETPTPQGAWISATSPATSLAKIREIVPAGVLVSAVAVDENRGILGAAAGAMWLGASGAGVLCVIAVFASADVQVRTRRDETFILRALGVSDREIVAGRTVELVIVATTGILTGIGAGLIVAGLTIAPLARAAVPGSYSAIATVTDFHLLGLTIGLSALFVGLGISLAHYARRVIE
jgi:ABC-type lipoprotein release transport system permease subunit